MVRSPIRWVGGKSRLRKRLISLFPEHECYVEVFGGAGWVLFGKDRSDIEIFNDIDDELVNFFRVVKNHPEELINSFRWVLTSRAEFRRLRELDPTELSEIERAHRFYYLIMASWGAELGRPRFQTSVSDQGGGNRLIGAVQSLESRIHNAYERLQGVIIESLDWTDCIDRYDRPGVLMYLDPPYPDNNCNYKHNITDWATHERIAETVETSEADIVLSITNSDKTRELYRGLQTVNVQFEGGMDGSTGRANRELIVTNYPV